MCHKSPIVVSVELRKLDEFESNIIIQNIYDMLHVLETRGKAEGAESSQNLIYCCRGQNSLN